MKKMKAINTKHTLLVTIVTAGIVINLAPMTQASSEKAVDNNLILHYDFKSLQSGTIANDVSNNGKAGVVRPTGSQVETEQVTIYGQDYTAFVMQGGSPSATNTYIEMPSGILNGLEDVTISCWTYAEELTSYQRIWDIGSGTTSYMYLLANGYNEGHTGYTSALTNTGWSGEKGPEKGENIDIGRWIYTTVTFDGSEKSMSLYEDGKLIDTIATDTDLSALQNSTQNYIGYGQFGNDIFEGKIADFKIYNYSMSQEEVLEQVEIPDKEQVERDKDSLTLGDISAVTEDLVLPTTGEMGTSITWETSDAITVSSLGKVTRPKAGKADKTVTLTATIQSGGEIATKTFEVKVKAHLTDRQIVEKDGDTITLGNLNVVTKDLQLPTKGVLGSSISWESSEPHIISDNGKVTRPIDNYKLVTLTAKMSYGLAALEKEFIANVYPVYEKLDIVEVADVKVNTSLGILPTLPHRIKVNYEDNTIGLEKVVWQADLTTEDFLKTGVKQIKGNIVDSSVSVVANVVITDKTAQTPIKVASGFDLSNISLDGNDTIFSQNMERALEYLNLMDADRMLYNFRTAFGQDTKGVEPLTGWEEPTGLLRGHSTGHFMSALAHAYASTGDEVYKEKMDYMITEMRKLQLLSKGSPEDFKTSCTPTDANQEKWSKDPETWGVGFISAYSPDQFALLEQYTPYATIWAPYYTMHKLLAGFLDCYTYGGNEEALEIAKDLGGWIYERLNACTAEQRSKMWDMYIAGEYGGMNESLTKLYEITRDERYLKTAQMFDNTKFFNNLSNNVDDIQNRHANQHIPQIVGALHEYAATQDPKYYHIARNFWDMVVARYSYSIGGVGTGERFKDPYQQGSNILGNSGRGENCETCAAYNMLKLTKDLYNYDPDNAAYMDYYERTLINQIIASQSKETTENMHNGVTYMLPIDPGQRKDFDSDYGGFTCCNGTGMENHVKYQEAVYAYSEDTLYVNLYIPTTVEWKEKGITVKQETTFPSENSKLTIGGAGDFTMKLRVPYWATDGFTIKVNGDVICLKPEVSTYVEINRTWSDGDIVEINMPYTLHLDKTPDKVDGNTVASLMYGPIVMVAKDTREEYTPMNWYNMVLSENLLESVEIVTGTDSDQPPHLIANGLDFYPMYNADNYRYHTYVKVEEKISNVAGN